MGLAPSLLGPPQPDEVKALLRRAQAFEAVERCVLGGYIGQRQAGSDDGWTTHYSLILGW